LLALCAISSSARDAEGRATHTAKKARYCAGDVAGKRGSRAQNVRGGEPARDLDAYFEDVDPEIEFHLSGAFPDLEAVYRGRAGVQKFFEQFAEPWEELSVEPNRIFDLDTRVLVLFHFRARGRDGIEVQLPLAHLWTMREAKAVRMDAYSDQRKALEAAGLSEQDVHADSS
jgi:ketosteroid isomerase-like protein